MRDERPLDSPTVRNRTRLGNYPVSEPDHRRVIVDSGTAGDDTQAISLAALSDRVSLALSDGTDDVTVYEGASRLEKVERRRG